MLFIEDKILVHFYTNAIYIYRLKNHTLKLLCKEQAIFEENSIIETWLEKINYCLDNIEESVGVLNDENIRLYATGIFQKLTPLEQDNLRIHVFVYYGISFNIIQPELEEFYLEKSKSVHGSQTIMDGLAYQEFRKVVVCGSFQQHMKDIEEVITVLNKYHITVLSPWTTKIVAETIGTDFILLEGQELINKRDAWRHKCIHMNKFTQCDAIIVCNPNGRIGKGTMFEFGFMVAYSKRIIFTERPKNLTISFPYEVGLNFK